jgi:hypothetical protein
MKESKNPSWDLNPQDEWQVFKSTAITTQPQMSNIKYDDENKSIPGGIQTTMEILNLQH